MCLQLTVYGRLAQLFSHLAFKNTYITPCTLPVLLVLQSICRAWALHGACNRLSLVQRSCTGCSACVYTRLVLLGYVHAAQRFAWEINPRNYLLLACHAANETVQLNQLRRWYGYHYGDPTESNPKVCAAQAALCNVQRQLNVLLWLLLASGTLQIFLSTKILWSLVTGCTCCAAAHVG